MSEQARENNAPRPASTGDDVSFAWLLLVLLRGRRTIAVVVLIGFVAALVAALFRPTYFTSTFSFIPQAGQDQGRSGLASIAGQFGIALGGLGGQSQPPQLYADLLETHGVLDVIARDTVIGVDNARVPLSELLGAKGADSQVLLENTVTKLRDKVITTSVAARTTGMVTVNVRTRVPKVSQRIAQQLLDGLNRFNVATRRSQASEERRFVESRLAAANASLRSAENALQQFLQSNRQMGAFSVANFQRERLEREVALQQQIVNGLAQQFEDARIREVRDTPVITVIEPPSLPVLPDPKGRIVTLAMGLIGSLFVGVALVLAREGWRRQHARERTDVNRRALSAEWSELRSGAHHAD
jgi:uncharacterized protein involved in exopolysaccharide biosynthesis